MCVVHRRSHARVYYCYISCIRVAAISLYPLSIFIAAECAVSSSFFSFQHNNNFLTSHFIFSIPLISIRIDDLVLQLLATVGLDRCYFTRRKTAVFWPDPALRNTHLSYVLQWTNWKDTRFIDLLARRDCLEYFLSKRFTDRKGPNKIDLSICWLILRETNP